MATNRKRSTRTSRSSTARSTSTQSRPVSGRDEAAEAAAAAAKSLAWDNEYQHIKKDLRQLGIVSVVLTALLLVVGFII